MEYASFYGGRKGSSFIIVKNYKDIPSMVHDFSQGGNFTGVNYDEYVIINTVNKNHPDNGKIFRRGYDYNSTRTIEAYCALDANNEEIINGTDEQYRTAIYQQDNEHIAGGAIYVGTIVGPSGRSPQLKFTTYAAAYEKQAQPGIGSEQDKGSGSYTFTAEDLVPGKYTQTITEGSTTRVEDRFNDVIQWCYTSIRDFQNEDTQVYIGFKIPYLVVDYETQAVAPYDASENYADMSNIERVYAPNDTTVHPFYQKWKLDIPHGVKGDALKNFRVITPTSTDVIYAIGSTAIYSDFDNDIPNSTYELKPNGRQILVYDYYNYDVKQNGDPKTYYLGDYNQITDFTIDNDGTLTIAFTHEDTITYHQLIRWIENIQLDQDTGHFTVTYNTTTTKIITEGSTQIQIQVPETDEFDLDWVKRIEFVQDENDNYDGTVKIYYTVSQDETYPKLIKWIHDISLASQTIEATQPGESDIIEGTFLINYNDGTSLIEYLKWVNDITLSSHGDLTLHYSGNGTDKVITSSAQQNFIKWINDIELSNDGIITITYNTGHEETTLNPQSGEEEQIWIPDTQSLLNQIKWVTGVTFDNNGDITVNYNTGQSYTAEQQIKWIQNINLDTQTGLFEITYNQSQIPASTFRLKLPKDISIETQADGSNLEGTGSQKVKITYTTVDENTNENVIETIGEPLNYIMQTRVTDDRHLIILYADPNKRNELITNHKAYNFGRPSPYEYTDQSTGYAGWLDLGSIYVDSGILIGLNIDIDDVPHSGTTATQTEIVSYLNTQYGRGLQGADVHGKIITVGHEDGEKSFYGFNYNHIDDTDDYEGWYYLGTFSNTSVFLDLENQIPANAQEEALWFVVEKTCSVTYNLTNADSTNRSTFIENNGTYTTKIIGTNLNVSVTMGSTNITNSVYNSITNQIIINSSNLNVPKVTDDLVITAVGV